MHTKKTMETANTSATNRGLVTLEALCKNRDPISAVAKLLAIHVEAIVPSTENICFVHITNEIVNIKLVAEHVELTT